MLFRSDFAEDQRAAVRFLSGRKDVDQKRIAVVGHSEGGLVSLLAAAREKRIAAVVLIASPGTTGAELVLAQQQHLLSRSNLSDADKQARIDLQKRINEAAMTGKGLDSLSADIRRQVDNAEFQSLLTTDPAKIIPGVRPSGTSKVGLAHLVSTTGSLVVSAVAEGVDRGVFHEPALRVNGLGAS